MLKSIWAKGPLDFLQKWFYCKIHNPKYILRNLILAANSLKVRCSTYQKGLLFIVKIKTSNFVLNSNFNYCRSLIVNSFTQCNIFHWQTNHNQDLSCKSAAYIQQILIGCLGLSNQQPPAPCTHKAQGPILFTSFDWSKSILWHPFQLKTLNWRRKEKAKI